MPLRWSTVLVAIRVRIGRFFRVDAFVEDILDLLSSWRLVHCKLIVIVNRHNRYLTLRLTIRINWCVKILRFVFGEAVHYHIESQKSI